MNTYYVGYFKTLRRMSRSDIGAALAKENGIPFPTETDVNNYFYRMMDNRYMSEDEIRSVAECLSVSPEWFLETPCLISFTDLFYYLALMKKQTTPIVQPSKDPNSFVIYDEDLIKMLKEYVDQRSAMWKGQITKEEWEEYRLNCLKHCPSFTRDSIRGFRQLLKVQEYSENELKKDLTEALNKIAEESMSKRVAAKKRKISRLEKSKSAAYEELSHVKTELDSIYNEKLEALKEENPMAELSWDDAFVTDEELEIKQSYLDLDGYYRGLCNSVDRLKESDLHVKEVTEENVGRRLRMYLNGVCEPPKNFITAICRATDLQEDDYYCEFDFAGSENYFNLFVAADIMLCRIYLNTVDGVTAVSFDYEPFMAEWKKSPFSSSREVDEDSMFEFNDDDEEARRQQMLYARARQAGGAHGGKP